MDEAPGRKSGQSFVWADYVAWIAESAGSLTAAAEKIAGLGGFADDVASIERALRRLRDRGTAPGGKWGARALAVFGLPGAVEERVRWMGAYHSRFVDLPVPVCEDLVRLWDRPPTSERAATRTWLFLARAELCLRARDLGGASAAFAQARLGVRSAAPDAAIELLLGEAFVASRNDRAAVPALLAEVEPLLPSVASADDRACLHARWIDQLAYERQKEDDAAGAEGLYRTIAEADAPPFVLARRANGLAYARWKQGDHDGGAALAREACLHAGDGGHVRLRAMALQMLGRILGDTDAGRAARDRALAIAKRLDDEMLRVRFSRDRS